MPMDKNVIYLLAAVVGFFLVIVNVNNVQENVFNLPFWVGVIIVIASIYIVSRS